MVMCINHQSIRPACVLHRLNKICTATDPADYIKSIENHLLRCLLQPPSAVSQTYSLRRRPHSHLLFLHLGHLMDSYFVTHMLNKAILLTVKLINWLS